MGTYLVISFAVLIGLRVLRPVVSVDCQKQNVGTLGMENIRRCKTDRQRRLSTDHLTRSRTEQVKPEQAEPALVPRARCEVRINMFTPTQAVGILPQSLAPLLHNTRIIMYSKHGPPTPRPPV